MHQEVRAGTCSNHTALRQTLTPAFELQADYTCSIRTHLLPGWYRGCACMGKAAGACIARAAIRLYCAELCSQNICRGCHQVLARNIESVAAGAASATFAALA